MSRTSRAHITFLLAGFILIACNPEVVCPDGSELVDGRCIDFEPNW